MDSTQLIALYESLKQKLGEKATDWNMFLEGYVAGINDVDVKKQMIDKACEWIMTTPMYAKQPSQLVEEFRKAMERM